MRRLLLAIFIVSWSVVATHAQTAGQPKEYTAHVVGYAHMDMAWLWRWEESIHDIMYNTFRNQLDLMDQFPDYTYAQDQAVVFAMMERYYPDIFKEIQFRVKTHNWIPVSSTWTQMDENIPDGESLVRQFLYGQKYSKEKFGHYIRIAWQPDVYGHPYSMPQIAKKAGIEFYLFNRPHDAKRPPIIWWQGLDGSRVLGCTPPGEYTQPMDHAHMTVLGMKGADRVGVKNIMVLYGMGDHGGGPNPEDVAGIAKLNASPQDVRVKTTTVADYIDTLLAEKTDFPIINNEMNPVFTGANTTHAEMKRYYRQAEQLLFNAEKMSELAVFFDYRDYYPNRDLTEAWKITLLNETHDLAGGDGIGPIYDDAARLFEEVFERGNRALNFSLQSLGQQLDTQGEGVPVVVYNPQSWDRTDLVAIKVSDVSLPSRMVAVHWEERIPVQMLNPPTSAGRRQTATIAFVAEEVPQMGLKLYRLIPESTGGKFPASSLQVSSKPRPYLENEFVRVEINPETGRIARIFDKTNKREALQGEGNFLVALEDTADEAKAQANKTTGYTDEWASPAFAIGLTGKKWDISKPTEVEITEQGPARATIRVVYQFRHSVFVQDISLIAGVPRVDVAMTTDWHERSTFLKAGFPVSVRSAKVAAEIPYGAIEREQTGDEADMDKWIDISDANYGIAILNNGRNGFDAKDNVMRLSVIRGTWAPDPRADEGEQTFGYSIYPHKGGWREGKVEYQALAFNSPLLAMQEPEHASAQVQWMDRKGGLPDSYSFIQTQSDHVILYAMKQMEGFYDRDAIVRFFECEGRDGDVTIELPRHVHVMETNLLEDVVLGPVGDGTTIKFHMKPWEIKTLRLAKH